jgi:hypothetical protein
MKILNHQQAGLPVACVDHQLSNGFTLAMIPRWILHGTIKRPKLDRLRNIEKIVQKYATFQGDETI